MSTMRLSTIRLSIETTELIQYTYGVKEETVVWRGLPIRSHYNMYGCRYTYMAHAQKV